MIVIGQASKCSLCEDVLRMKINIDLYKEDTFQLASLNLNFYLSKLRLIQDNIK